MAKGSGGTRGAAGGAGGGFDFARDAIGAGHPLFEGFRKKDYEKTMASIDKNIKDPQLKAEMKAAVEKMHKEMGGLPTGMKVEIGMAKGFQGYEWHGKVQGKTITLNKKIYGGSYDKAEGRKLLSIKAGLSTSTILCITPMYLHSRIR